MGKNTTSKITFEDRQYLLTWIRNSNLQDYSPIDQVYGIVFNSEGEILIGRVSPRNSWQIPGGKPEKGETPVDTLERELREEVNVTVKKLLPLGVQKVELINGDSRELSSYQLRFVGLLDEVLTPSVDPASGTVWERQFVPAEKIKAYFDWGKVGEAMFHDAVELYSDIF